MRRRPVFIRTVLKRALSSRAEVTGFRVGCRVYACLAWLPEPSTPVCATDERCLTFHPFAVLRSIILVAALCGVLHHTLRPLTKLGPKRLAARDEIRPYYCCAPAHSSGFNLIITGCRGDGPTVGGADTRVHRCESEHCPSLRRVCLSGGGEHVQRDELRRQRAQQCKAQYDQLTAPVEERAEQCIRQSLPATKPANKQAATLSFAIPIDSAR